ncbi:MAG: YceI family protein [Cyclobacteriaceae bacterium]|nr:YceI family protein [Cyclobacteriaceae bacterium]UYN85925.1 MAG: YceI family protein [Cyclobacteriaceae bacterium]
MKKMYFALVALLVSGSAIAQSTWKIDNVHSKIGFSVSHMVVAETEGSFKDYSGSVVSKAADFAGAEVTFSAKVASINTDNEKRDGHLKSADFFDAEKFPEITFKGTLVKDGTKYKLKGDFTMKGVTKKIEFDVIYGGTINTGRGEKAGFKVSGIINRQDYGVNWANKLASGEMVVGDNVSLNIKIELDKVPNS